MCLTGIFFKEETNFSAQHYLSFQQQNNEAKITRHSSQHNNKKHKRNRSVGAASSGSARFYSIKIRDAHPVRNEQRALQAAKTIDPTRTIIYRRVDVWYWRKYWRRGRRGHCNSAIFPPVRPRATFRAIYSFATAAAVMRAGELLHQCRWPLARQRLF